MGGNQAKEKQRWAFITIDCENDIYEPIGVYAKAGLYMPWFII